MSSSPTGRNGLILFLVTLSIFLTGTVNARSDDSDFPAPKVSWQEKLRAQIVHEENAAGLPDHRTRIEAAMSALLEETKRKNESLSHSKPGAFSGLAQSQQMDRNFYLGPQETSNPSFPGGFCPKEAPVRPFDISAINLEITNNQWLDHHPGYLYALTKDIKKIREEEELNQKARKGNINDPGAVSHGLQTDLIQPLVIRANQGDCVVITLRNRINDEDVGIHIHGSSLVVQSTGEPASSANPDSTLHEGENRTFEWYIRPDEQEGAHMFHSHVGREQTSLGLVGALIVEPMGSRYLDPIKGKEVENGWQMMVVNPTKPDFREFVIFYNDIGDESFRTLNRNGEMVPSRDPNSDSYKPGHRGLNFRTEPFGINNLALQGKYFGFMDESMGYSAYTFGDTANPIPRSYMGDPAKFRLIHGGGENFHSHHPHGGTIRWLRQPKTDTKAGELFTAASNGPVKFPLIRTTSERLDVQMIGPSEALDLETECGSGLCQQLAGDFLFHCHVAHHYVSGMWSYWRVYNTLQDGGYPFSSTDQMPPLLELPDRKGRIQKTVTSDQLIGKTMDWYDKKWSITEEKSDWSKNIPDVSIKDWVRMMLPPAGEPGHTPDEKGQVLAYDASVWDWVWKGNRAFGEKEMTSKFAFPKYKSPMPGKRPPILFEPKTGKLAWPHFKPHFGKRVPFARHHGPAPWLEPIHMDKNTGAPAGEPGGFGTPGEETNQPARPGEQGRWSLCPENSGRKQYTLHFIQTPIQLSKKLGKVKPVTDPNGLLFVLHEDEAEVRADSGGVKTIPLVYRANVYDCVDVILKSEWNDNDYANFQASKVNIHPHFIQFDNQASDGVITGFSYEQSVRPFTQFGGAKKKGLPHPMNAHLTTDAAKGSTQINIKMSEGATPFHVGTEVMIGMDQVDTSEIRWIKDIKNNMLIFEEPLKFPHRVDEIASVEFVRYRYWADADVGTVYWHDHAMGLTTWAHGGVGAMIVEPPGATYHDPKTGHAIRSGPVADIHSTEPIGYGVNGSFRELVVMLQDTIPYTAQVVKEGNPPRQTKTVAIDAGQTLTFQMPYSIDYSSVPMLNGNTHTTGGGFNHRAESISRRLQNKSLPSRVFSSLTHQDPSTPLLRAYLGDTVVFRLLHSLMNETHTWHLAGHSFRIERFAGESSLRNAFHIGIAERLDLVTKAGGAQQMAGDYLHYNGRASHLSEGSWGILRVLDEETSDLKKLPGNPGIPTTSEKVCPSGAPTKTFNVVALDFPLNFNPNIPEAIEVDFDRRLLTSNPTAKIYLLEEETSRIKTKNFHPMPLTLRVNLGDCIKINLKNRLKKQRVSFSADLLAFDPKDSHGVNVGLNRGDQTVAPGKTRTYTFYAHPENGEIAALVWDWGNFINGVRDGLFGAIIVGPGGSKYRDPVTGSDLSLKNAWQADVLIDRTIPENAFRQDYRDFSLFFQDEDNVIGTAFMPYIQQVAGLTGVNYRIEPWAYREDEGCNWGNMFTNCAREGKDPATPTILAHAGDPVRIHVFGAFSEQNQVFSLEGHEWPFDPNMVGADRISSLQFGGSENLDVFIKEGAGGPFQIPGTYVWQNHRLPHAQAGQWGYLKVLPRGDSRILPLNPR